jgi:hypothetical protein
VHFHLQFTSYSAALYWRHSDVLCEVIGRNIQASYRQLTSLCVLKYNRTWVLLLGLWDERKHSGILSMQAVHLGSRWHGRHGRLIQMACPAFHIHAWSLPLFVLSKYTIIKSLVCSAAIDPVYDKRGEILDVRQILWTLSVLHMKPRSVWNVIVQQTHPLFQLLEYSYRGC